MRGKYIMGIKIKINKQYILFDLDGTITDSKLGILKSFQYAAKHFGIEIKDEDFDDYMFLIGPPIRDCFKQLGIFNDEEFEPVIAKYREYLLPKGIYENKLYPGIEDLLKNLRNAGKTIILATSKNEQLANKILDYFKILKYFDFTAGADPDGRRSKKSEVILYALEQYGVLSDEDKLKAVMVGDRNHDIIGAAKAGLESVGVLYGYGSEEELSSGEYKATYIVKNVGELTELLFL